jgi:hypothetical protein
VSISRRQANGATGATGGTGTPPGWGTATVLNNLLLLIVNSRGGNTASDTAVAAAGWNRITDSPFNYYSGGSNYAGIYWKIAAGGDATPPAFTDSGTPTWDIYTYEFASTTGWISSANDVTVHSAASNTAGTTKASGSSATLAQTDELALAINAASVARSAFAFTGSFVIDLPTTNSTALEVGWYETAATTALATTPTWTTSARNVSWVVSFKPNSAGNAVSGASALNGLGSVRPGRWTGAGRPVFRPGVSTGTATVGDGYDHRQRGLSAQQPGLERHDRGVVRTQRRERSQFARLERHSH